MSTECFWESVMFTSVAYGNFFFFSSRVAQKREDAVSKEVTRKLSEADNRKMSRKEKDERFDSYLKYGRHKRGYFLNKIFFYFCLKNVDFGIVWGKFWNCSSSSNGNSNSWCLEFLLQLDTFICAIQ